ncbi:hypothetical protein [Kordia sp.]|uniref:hypothetical protein n=1 Tax=Kordia sp. TaxID=1965332 RepID=UPI003D28A9AE
MRIKKKSLNLKKFKIANLNQTFIYGGTGTTSVATTSVDCTRPSDPPECYIYSEPLVTCTSIGQLKSLEREGAECKGEVVGSLNNGGGTHNCAP